MRHIPAGMLDKRITTYILLLATFGLILFVGFRSGSADIASQARASGPLSIRVLDQPPPRQQDTLILNDYEKINDRMNMYDQGGDYRLSLGRDHATHGHYALVIDRNPGSNMELATVHFPRQWTGYDVMEFDLYNDSEIPGTIWVRVGSQFDARRFYPRSQKFARAFSLRPGPNTISIQMDDIRRAFGKLPTRKTLHFNFPADGGGRYYMDFLRLVKHDGTVK
jgi:hypothetical protein